MDISHDTYSSFLADIKCDHNLMNKKWKTYKNSNNIYKSDIVIMPSQQFDLSCLQTNDLMSIDMFDQESVNEITTQGIDKIAFYCFELFEKIGAQVELSPNKARLLTEYTRFKTNYEKMYNAMFSEMEFQRKMLNIFNELLTSTFDWIIVYSATQYSAELFKIILDQTSFLNSTILTELLTRVVTGKNTLLDMISLSRGFQTFINSIGKKKIVELFFCNHHLLFRIIYGNLFKYCITSDDENEQCEITKILLETRYPNGDNFLNVVFNSQFEAVPSFTNQTFITEFLLELKPYKCLLDEKNNAGYYCYYSISNLATNMIMSLMSQNIITLSHLLKINDGFLPLSYNYYISKIIWDNLNVYASNAFEYDKTTLIQLIPTLLFYINNYITDEDTEDESDESFTFDYNVHNILSSIVEKIKKLDDIEEFLTTEVVYYTNKSYPIMYYLFSISFQENFFKLPIDDKLHIAFESFLIKYPFMLPVSGRIESEINKECTETIKKLVKFGKCEFIEQYYQKILTPAVLDYYLINEYGMYFLNSTIMLLNTNESPYNILKIFNDFANDINTSIDTINSLTDQNFTSLVKILIEMYVKSECESYLISKKIFEWAYNFKSELFCSTLNSIEIWPTYFMNSYSNENLFVFFRDVILPNIKMQHENIFGSNIDNYPVIFTKYSTDSSIIYDKLIEHGHLDKYYSQNFNTVYNLLCLRDIKIAKAIVKLPNFSSAIFYENYEDQDLLRQSCFHNDIQYCEYLLDISQPTLDYKRKFITTIDFTKYPNLLCLLLKKQLIHYTLYDSIDNYINAIKFLTLTIKSELSSNITNFSHEELNELLAIDVCHEILILFMSLGENYLIAISNQLNSEYFKNCLKLHDSQLTYFITNQLNDIIVNQSDNGKLILKFVNSLLQNNIFRDANIVLLIKAIISFDHNAFQIILSNYNMVKLLEYEIDYRGNTTENNMENSFLINALKCDQCHMHLLNWMSNVNNLENSLKLIQFCSKNNFDIMEKILEKCNLAENEHYIKLLIVINPLLITNIMVSQLILDEKEDLIVKCIKSGVNINSENFNQIVNKYPECTLLFNNTQQLISNMTDNDIISLFKSPYMTPEIQDFILNHLLSLQKLSVMVECILNMQVESQFVENNSYTISKLIEIDNEVFYILMKNGFSVDKYLLTMDSTENYMLPFIPDGYVEDSLIEKFISKLSLADLNKCDIYGRSVFSNFVVNPFLKFVLARSDINEFYTNNLNTLKLVLDNIVINHYELIRKFPKSIVNTITNNKNQNILMILLENNQCESAMDFLNNDADNISLEHLDNNGCNVLFYAVLQPDIFEDILHIYLRDYGEKCVKIHNNLCETLLMYAIKYGVNNPSFEILLQNDKFKEEQNYVYANKGSILTYGAIYLNETQFESLLNWKYINGNHLNVTQTFEIYDWFSGNDPLISTSLIRGSLLTIASFYNCSIFKQLIKYYSHFERQIKTILFKEKISINKSLYSLVEFSYLYNPESFQHILGLQFIDELVLPHKFFSNNYNVQPASWFYYCQSTLYHNTIENIYNIAFYLRPQNIKLISTIVQSKQECGTNLTDICNICSVGKKKIMFGCNLHLACVNCGCSIETCPECKNNEVNKKIKVFN